MWERDNHFLLIEEPLCSKSRKNESEKQGGYLQRGDEDSADEELAALRASGFRAECVAFCWAEDVLTNNNLYR